MEKLDYTYLYSSSDSIFRNIYCQYKEDHRSIKYQKFIIDEVREHLSQKRASYLSIGCGDGNRTSKIMAELSNVLSIDFYYNDPAEWQYKAFKKKIALKPEKTEGVFLSPFCECTFGSTHFDIIESIHSWYPYTKNIKQLERLLSLLNTNGTLIVILASKEGLEYNILKFLKNKLDMPTIDVGFFEDLLNTLKKTGKKFRCKKNKFLLGYPSLTKGDILSNEGALLCNFMSGGKIDLTDPSLVKELVKFFNSLEHHRMVSGGVSLWKA